MIQQTPRALALVGMPGSGKTVCAHYLKARGFAHYRFGSIIVDEVVRRGWQVNPANEQIVREELRAQEGMNAVIRRALPYLREALAAHNCLVIDGLYGFGEYKLLHEEFGGQLVVVAIVSARGLRYERLSQRSERPLTEAEAIQRDFREIETLEKGGPIALADYTLLNDGSQDDLLAALAQLTDKLGFYP